MGKTRKKSILLKFDRPPSTGHRRTPLQTNLTHTYHLSYVNHPCHDDGMNTLGVGMVRNPDTFVFDAEAMAIELDYPKLSRIGNYGPMVMRARKGKERKVGFSGKFD
ncbi:hypothetical protein Fot_03405 [Forsythia ovata]|uniref:Uncharacterized protein n=1 Tax=Forsythia ovata TaxID=205694 RepID=A0ABD1XA84_9LAMI